MAHNSVHRQIRPVVSAIVAAALFLPSCSPQPNKTVALSDKTARDAIAIAQTQAAKYVKVPDCRSGGPAWRYGVRAEGDFIVVKLGAKNPKGPSFRVTMRKADLGVVGTDRLS
jgi:hypothetical protein